NDWISGYEASVIIENKTNGTLKDWNLAFDFNKDVSSPWNAQLVSKTGNRYLFDAKPYTWNSSISPRGKVSFGFTGAPGQVNQPPSNFAFGTSGTTPTPTPTP